MDKRFEEYDEKMDKKFEESYKIMDEKIEENNKKIIDLINDNSETLLAITNKKIDDLSQKIDDKVLELEQKIVDNNFYLEKIYGDRIDGMFEKLMMMDKTKYEDHKEIKSLEKRIDYNTTVLGLHDMRIAKLEKNRKSS